MSGPAPGWYRDPESPANERWWDGAAWAEPSRRAEARQHRDAGIGGCLAFSLALMFLLGVLIASRPAALIVGWIPLALVLYLDWRHR